MILGGGARERAAVVKALTGCRTYQEEEQAITVTHTRYQSNV